MKQQKINEVYNDGIVSFVRYSFDKDKYNTKLTTKTDEVVKKFWFRTLGISATEMYQAKQVDTEVSTRIAVRLFYNITDYLLSELYVVIKNKEYTIARIYHNHNKNETELSLVEVIK